MANEVKEFTYEYNPVKELKGGAEAAKVVWSTASLNAAVDALAKGLPLKANPFCGTNTKLLKPDLVYKRTKEEVEDVIKCMQDPVYFANKCFLMTPEGLKQVKMRDYQEGYLNHMKNNRFSIMLACRQAGKTVNFCTNILIKVKNKELVRKFKIYSYISDDIYELPMFELYNIYCKQTLLWRCKYKLYSLVYKINNK